MKTIKCKIFFLFAVAALILGGCATSPSKVAELREKNPDYFITDDGDYGVKFAPSDDYKTGKFIMYDIVPLMGLSGLVGATGTYTLDGDTAVISSINYTQDHQGTSYKKGSRIGISPSLIAGIAAREAEKTAQTARAAEELKQALKTDFNEADFTVALTADQKGVVIKKYNGSTTMGRIPATIQGMPVREIGTGAYQGSKITAVAIPEGVTKIGDGAFSKSSLASVVIPEGVTEIGSMAFRGCPLISVTLPQSLTTMGYEVFAGTRLTEISIPGSLREVKRERADWTPSIIDESTPLKTITIGEGITDVSYIYDCPTLTTVNLPKSLKTISGFWKCTALTNLTLPEGLIGIESEREGAAFSSCTALTTVTIPSTVRFIGDYAFSSCSSLTSAALPDATVYIASNAFSNNTKLNLATQAALSEKRAAAKQALAGFTVNNEFLYRYGLVITGYPTGQDGRVVVPSTLIGMPVTYFAARNGGLSYNDNVTSVVISEGVLRIGGSAFFRSNLTSVTLPSTIEEIGVEAFSECNKLTTVTIPASVKAIRFGNNCFASSPYLTPAVRARLQQLGYK